MRLEKRTVRLARGVLSGDLAVISVEYTKGTRVVAGRDYGAAMWSGQRRRGV